MYIKNIINEWETLMIKQCLERNTEKKNVYICSPLRADDTKGVMENMQKAKEYMFYVYSNLGLAAHAPHAYLPTVLNDNIPSERVMALQVGLKVLEHCDELFVCGNRISNGMKGEILYAFEQNKDIRVFDRQVYNAITGMLKSCSHYSGKVYYDKDNIMLSCSGGLIFPKGGTEKIIQGGQV